MSASFTGKRRAPAGSRKPPLVMLGLFAAVSAMLVAGALSPARAQGQPLDPYGRPLTPAPAKPAPVDPYGAPVERAPPKPAPAKPAPAKPAPAKPAPAKPAPVDPYAAEPAPPSGPPTATPGPARGAARSADPEVEGYVAQALFERGKLLFARGDYASAKTLLLEAIERAPDERLASDATAMLAVVNGKLGLPAGDGLSAAALTTTSAGGGGPRPDQPVDPYATGAGTTGVGPVDPYAAQPGGGALGGATAALDDTGDRRRARQTVLGSSTGLGFVLGMGLVGPEDAAGEFQGGAILVGALGALGGAALSYYATRDRELSLGDANAVASAGLWGAALIGLFADVATGIDQTTANDVAGGAAIGALLGTGAGVLLARRYDPSAGDVALVNSLGLYGASGGLLLAAAIDAAEDEGYTLNMVLGGAIGIGVGTYLSSRREYSRTRMFKVDLFALGGAAVPWLLLYPLVADGTTASDTQLVGLLSSVTLAGGALLGFHLTRDSGKGSGAQPVDPLAAPPPALLGRASTGQWQLGLPLIGPATSRLLAGEAGPRGVSASLLSARF